MSIITLTLEKGEREFLKLIAPKYTPTMAFKMPNFEQQG